MILMLFFSCHIRDCWCVCVESFYFSAELYKSPAFDCLSEKEKEVRVLSTRRARMAVVGLLRGEWRVFGYLVHYGLP